MKVNTFKKTISVAAAAAMVAQLGFVMPVSAEDVSVDILDSNYQVTVTDDGNVLSIPVTNNSGEASVVNAYVATYKDGLLNKIAVDSASIENAASETLSIEYDAPAAGETVKLFVWTDSNKPITASKVIAEGEEVTENPTDDPTDNPTDAPTDAPTSTPTDKPDTAEIIYSQDYESASSIGDLWTAGSFTDGLALGNDRTQYAQFGNSGQAGGRSASTNFTADVSDKSEYVVEFDLALTQPTGYSGTSQFAIRTGSAPSQNNTIALDNSLFLMEFENGTTNAVINGVNAASFSFPSGGWCHYTIYTKADSDLATVTITDLSTDAILLDKVVVPVNDGIESVTGAFVHIGRGNGNMKFDNLVVRGTDKNDQFGEMGEETLSSITLSPEINTKIYQPDMDSPVHMPLAVKAEGIYGSDITDKVDIKWTTEGIAEEDGYISLTKESGAGLGTDGESPDGSSTAYFNVRNGVSNWFGRVVVTVTYLDKTLTASTPFAVIGATSAGTNLAPETGYYENMSHYADDLVGYQGTSNGETTKDLVLNNWSIYGSNGARTLTLNQDEDSTKYLRFGSNGGGGTTVGVYQLENQDEQYIVDMTVRFTGGNMTFGHYLKTPNNSGNDPSWTCSYESGSLKLGNQSISGLNSEDWFRIVVSADESAGTSWLKAYNSEGTLLGEIDAEPLLSTASAGQKFFAFMGTFPVDLAKFRIYYPTTASLSVNGGDGVIQVPEKTSGGDSVVTEDLTAILTDTDGYDMTGTVLWSLDDEYTGVEINSTGAQTAELKIDETAAAGDITVVASYGTMRYEKTITLSTSGNSIAFTSSTSSITIPFDGEADVTASFAAEARNKEGSVIDTDNGVTLTLVDAQGDVYNNDKITFVDGVLTVKAGAPSKTLYVKADATVTTEGEEENLSSRVKVNIHGLSFAFGTDDPADESYTKVTSADAYSDKVGYGFADVTAVTDGTSNVTGKDEYRFKAKVPNGNYVVTVSTTSATILSEVVEGVSATTGITKTGTTFKVAVCDGVLDLTFASGSTLSEISISQDVAKSELSKPMLYAIGDSTTNSTSPGFSWGNCIPGNVTVPDELSGFANHGKAGDDSVIYYNSGRVENVLLAICPGDYVTVNMGINSKEAGEPESYYTLLDEYYVQGIIQRGGIPIIVTATPQGPVNKGEGNYNAETGVFTCNRGTGAHNGDLRNIAQKYNLNIIELGYWADDYFNGLTVEDAQAAGKSSVIELVKSWYPDHNHYTVDLGKTIAEYILDCVVEIEGGSDAFNQANDPHINEQ